MTQKGKESQINQIITQWFSSFFFSIEISKLKIFLKDIQVKFFTLDQNVGISLKFIVTKFEISTPSRFQDNAIQN